MSALSRTMLSIWYGLPMDPADSEELGRIFDETPLYGVDPPEESRDSCSGWEPIANRNADGSPR